MSAQPTRQDSSAGEQWPVWTFKIRKPRGDWTEVSAETIDGALKKFRKAFDAGLADDLEWVDLTEDKRKSIILLSPVYDCELIPVDEPTQHPPKYFALRAPDRPRYALRDFVIDKHTIPVVRPARISRNEWGVRLTEEQVEGVRNHRIVRVRTRQEKRWYAAVDAIVQRTERGVILSVSESKPRDAAQSPFWLWQQKCSRFRAWTLHEQQVARGEIPRDLPNEHAPIQNEKLMSPLRHYRGKGTHSQAAQSSSAGGELGPPPTSAQVASVSKSARTPPVGGQTFEIGR